MSDHIDELIKEFAISSDELLKECDIQSNQFSRPYIDRSKLVFDLENSDINQLNTYNAIRILYRNLYDLRSKGTIQSDGTVLGREIHPISNYTMSIDYINDFSISPYFISEDSNFIESICKVYPNAYYAFTDKGPCSDYYSKRLKTFVEIESNLKPSRVNIGTLDFFSSNIQVNPLLYAFSYLDSNNKLYYMDADFFLENNLYNMIFTKESFILKGNQLSIPIWLMITNLDSTQRNLYDDNGEFLGTEEVYKNQQMLMKDNYTNELMLILQQPSRFYNFNRQTDYEVKDETCKVTEQETRGHLLFDSLTELLFRKIKDFIELNDSENKEKHLKRINSLEHFVFDPFLRNTTESGQDSGIPIDQYFALNSYKQCKEDIQGFMNQIRDTNILDDYLLNVYQHQYKIVFKNFFRCLPYILSPAYMYDIQSPSMNIFYTALTIMAIKEMYYNPDHTDYDIMMNILYENILCHIDELDIKQDMFDKVFTNKVLSKYISSHLKIILKILISNKSAINYDQSKINEIDTYFNDDKFYSYIETEVDDSILIDKALILLTEFFYKTESLRYFDASTFSIDYSLLESKENRKSLKLFTDSLMEACYIHMNILGHEYNDRKGLIGLDTTRVAKQNVNLINQWVNENKQYYVNSYHSYLSIINLYTSLVYCIQISIDNLSVNTINVGPYNSSNIRRSQALWTILKRYAIHMTYMNDNSYGIYNDVKISNNDKVNIQSYMVSQRIKWLTYGLHLRVWFNDGYFFYTNYKKLILNKVKEIINTNMSLYNTYNNLEELPLFREYTKNQFVLPLPNIGLSLFPMAGSYSILANANCIKFYLNNSNSTIVNLIHYGLKDIAVGDSMSSILGKRLECVRNLLNNEKLSFNNLRRFQKLYNHLGKSKYFEIALSSNLDYIYKNTIRPYFINNKNNCISLNNSTYDISFFEKTNDNCSYPLAYNNSWANRLISKLLDSMNNKEYMSLISRLITLYRINVANFKTWHIRSENDSIPNSYYRKFYGYNTMFSSLINIYNDYNKIYQSCNDKNGLFNIILRNIYTGNYYNNPYTLSNIFSITDSKFGFEENIINNTAGGSIYALYESPLALMIYNNINFNSGLVEPSIEQLFMLGMDLYARIYLTMKKLLIDLCKNGKPFEKIMKDNSCSLNEAKDIFINECITLFYIILDNKYKENISNIFKNIKDKNNIYSFVSIFGQFMDYDYISSQIVHCLDSQYKCDDSDAIRFINDILSNKKESIQRFNYYCSCVEKIDNQLNYINRVLEQSKNGTLLEESSCIESLLSDEDSNTFNEFKEEYLSTLSDKKRQSMTNYPLNINDNTGIIETNYISKSSVLPEYISYHIIGINEEDYKNLSDNAKKEYDSTIQKIQSTIEQAAIDYNSKISKLENELAQMRRAKDIADGKRVFDVKEGSILTPSDLEMYTLLKERKDINLVLFDKMNHLEIEMRTIKEVLLDTRHMIQLLNEKIISSNNDKQETIQRDENNETEEESEQEIQESITIQQNNNELSDIDTLNNFAIKVNQDNINRTIIQDDHQYRLPIQPECFKDKVIFRSNTGYEYIILKDYNVDYDLDVILNKIQNRDITYGLGFIRPNFKTMNDIPEDVLNSPYSVIDKNKASYNDYVYVPKRFLLQYLPSVGKPLSSDTVNNRKRTDKAKLILQNVPIYSCDDYNLICPIDNIPISFNQKKEYIISDISDRIVPYDKVKADKIIKYLLSNNVMNDWDNDNMTLYARCIFMRSVFKLNVDLNTEFV